MPVGELEAPTQVAEPKTAESINPLGAEAGQEERMVNKKVMTIDQFLPDTGPVAQPQYPQGRDQVPPPPASQAKKRKHVTEKIPRVPGNAPSKTSPRVFGGPTIQELISGP